MKILKFVACWTGPVLVLFGMAYWLKSSAELPFPLSIILPAIGVLITLIAWWLTRNRHRRTSSGFLLSCVILGALFCGWQYWGQARSYREITIHFNSRDAQLTGTLFLPNTAGKVPGIVMVHGSGPLRRWIYKLFGADHFARAGFAVLTYDKRGIGDSSGHYEGPCNTCPDNLELLANDASAALSFLAARPEVDAVEVGYWGTSQAGWIVPKAAVKNGHAAFMLLITAPTTTVHQNMRYERFTGTPVTLPQGSPTPDEAEVLAARANQQFAFPDTDPALDLQRLNIPGLWIMADRDGMVPPGRSIGVLKDLIALGKPYEYLIIPGAGHGVAVSGEPRQQYWKAVDAWLARVTKR